ncbi:MAG: sigma-70 family RNA polymerase sigma factor [Firmicutes bacterium]|nr:sigma-70 family RNA polymerase sigma factor [Bacillota bacterium]
MPEELNWEKEAVARAQKDPKQFGVLYEYYFPKIYNYISYRLRNQQLAEDITADIFLKAFDNLDKFQWRNRSFACWLYTIARNQVVDYFRDKDFVPVEDSFLESIPDEENPEQLVVEKDLRKQWLDLIKTLSPAQQDVLLLRFQQGLKLKEIAAILSKNEGAIKALLFRGLKSLRKNIEEGGLEL